MGWNMGDLIVEFCIEEPFSNYSFSLNVCLNRYVWAELFVAMKSEFGLLV